MNDETPARPALIRKHVPPSTSPTNLDLTLYTQPLEALATVQGEVEDRIQYAQDRLDYLTSKASAANLAIEQFQTQLGALNDARSKDEAEAQSLRDAIFEHSQYLNHIDAALARAVRSREMAEEGERLRISRLPWQQAYEDIKAEAEAALTETLVLYVRSEGCAIGGIQWPWFFDHVIRLSAAAVITKQEPALLASLEHSRSLVAECDRLALLATGYPSYYPTNQFYNAARAALDSKE